LSVLVVNSNVATLVKQNVVGKTLLGGYTMKRFMRVINPDFCSKVVLTPPLCP
jgi:hypothetical protein